MTLSIAEVSISSATPDDPQWDFGPDWEALKVPQLELPSTAYGGTGYIDGMLALDLPAPVMKGVDREGRKFIAFLLWREEGYYSHLMAVVVFQRRPDKPVWVNGGRSGTLFRSDMKKSDRDRILALLRGEAVEAPVHGQKYRLSLSELRGGDPCPQCGKALASCSPSGRGTAACDSCGLVWGE